MFYDLEHRKWVTTNKKCLAVIKNTIELAIVGSIPEYDTVTEYLDRIKSQFTGSSKTYATQLIKQLMTERYSGNGKCKMTFNNACISLAILQNELYLLSLRDDVNVVCNDGNIACDNENVSSSVDVNKKRKRAHDASSKL